MGQTLTHGIYLPDEGERNCYDGLASNWSILDGAVGTIAEHTTALAGKAPAVHTHTKADITDFPVYGTTAGTICEGNDSRLSDARTPVAHTHTKSDVTDLFNSANTWSALNTYSNGQIRIKSQSQEIGVIPSSGVIQYLEFADKNNAQHGKIGLWDYDNGASEIQVSVSDKYKDGVKDSTGTSDTVFLSFGFKADGSKFLTFSGQVDNSVIPKVNNSYDLGSSSYQWNNLYAKNYYYNGVAWGLDKDNTWSQINDFKTLRLYGAASNNLVMYPPSGEKGDSSTFSFNIICKDKNAGGYNASGVANIGMGQSAGTSYVALNASTKGSTDNNIHSIQVGLQIAASDNANTGSFYPTQNGGINLGTSTNKWKTLNGINPGALSIFNPSATQDPIDVPNTWITDGSAWNTLNVSNMGDGWICLTYRLCGPNDYILARFGGTNAIIYPSMIFPATRLADSGYFVYALMPVAKAMGNIYLEIKLDSNAVLVKHSFIPAYGTV